MSDTHFSIGVIGATGYVASPYRKEIRESGDDAAIVALCSRRRELLEAAGEEDGASMLTDDWREVVEHPEVNLVIVAMPDALHYEPVMACAAAGKHVLCEKPVGHDAQQAAEMWIAFRKARLASFVPFWTRYAPVFRRARELYQSGALGEIQAVVYRWHNPRPAGMPFTWRDNDELSSAGSIADVGSHAYDTLRWILGQEAKRVLAHAEVIAPPKPDVGEINLEEAIQLGGASKLENASRRMGTAFDYANIALRWECGAVGTIVLSHATYLRKGLAPELELHGEEASLAVDRIGGRLTIARPDGEAAILETISDTGFVNRFEQHVFPALAAQIAGQKCDHPDLQDGWRVQCFTDAAARSARTGAWVDVGGRS